MRVGEDIRRDAAGCPCTPLVSLAPDEGEVSLDLVVHSVNGARLFMEVQAEINLLQHAAAPLIEPHPIFYSLSRPFLLIVRPYVSYSSYTRPVGGASFNFI